MKRPRNNKGFSLIEVLIAVTILTIIVAPLLHSFATAARTSAKSKRILQATAIGQNLMEEMKGSVSMEEFLKKWTLAASADEDGNYYYEPKEKQETDGREYYVRLYVDSESFTASGAAPAATDYNSSLWAKVSNLSRANNAFFIANVNETSDVAREIRNKMPADVSISESMILAGLKREFRIDIEYDPGTKKAVVKASATYTYDYGGTTYTYRALSGQEIYNNGMDLNNELENIFICYYPLSNSTQSNRTESVYVTNTDNCPVGVNLVQQTGAVSSNYGVDLYVKETAQAVVPVDASGKPIAVTRLATNLNYDEVILSYDGSAAADRAAVDSLLDFSYTQGGVNGLERGEAANRIYKVKIEVYRKDEGGVYDQDNLLTTLEGTKTE